MSIEALKSMIPDYAKDTKLNLSKIMTVEGATGLTEAQIFGTALACSYSLKNKTLLENIRAVAETVLDEAHIQAAKSASSIMAMNNIYYRFVHLVEDSELSHMPAGLRMQVIMNSGIEKKDFELYALAISSINGCGMCMDSHVKTLIHEGLSKSAIQSSIKIAAILASVAQVLTIEG